MPNERIIPGLGLKAFADLGSDDWKPWFDENMILVSPVARGWAKSRTTVLPGTGTTGDVYIVRSDDGTNPNKIALWEGPTGAPVWTYRPPVVGLRFYIEDEDKNYQYKSGGWVEFTAAIGGIPKATAADIRSGAVDKYIAADGVTSAAAVVTLTDAATVAVDWSTFINGVVTLGGNRTLGNPTNPIVGTTRTIRVIQDGTGSRTLAFAANYKHPGGTAPVLTTTPNAKDFFQIFCVSSTEFFVTRALAFA